MSEKIIREFQNELFAFIRHKVKDTDASKDILQEVLIKIHLKYDQLEKKESSKNWLYRIASNAIMDHFRKKNPMTGPLAVDIGQDEEESFDEIQQKLACCLKPFINKLPEAHKEALLNTDLGKMSQKEFAKAKGLSYSGVKSTVQRARLRLKGMFDTCCKIQADKYGQVMAYAQYKSCSCS